MRFDHLVIGAGASGMTAALILARAGFRVALVEKAPRTAPLLRGFSRGGIDFDTGFHYTGGLGEGETLDLFFRYLGLSGRVEKRPFDEDGFDVFLDRDRDFEYRFPVGRERIRASLLRAFPAEGPAIEAYLRSVEEVCLRLPYLNLEAGLGSTHALQGVHGPSLREVLDGLTGNGRLKEILSLHGLLYGVPPQEVPFDLHACVVGPYYRSVHGIEGGGGSLVEAFDAELKERGVEVFCGRGVREILFSPAGLPTGVRLEGGEVLESGACLATVHPRTLLDLVPEGIFRPVYRRRLQGLEESLPAFVLYGACERPLQLLEGRNLFLVPPAEGETRQTWYLTGAGERGFVAIGTVAASMTDPWKDSSRGERPEAYGRFKRETAQKALRRLEAALPELRGNATVVESATPLTLRDYVNAPAGGLYGVKHKVGQYNPQPATRVEGLYLAGQAVAAPGVLGAMLSAFLGCGHILGHDRLRREVMECS